MVWGGARMHSKFSKHPCARIKVITNNFKTQNVSEIKTKDGKNYGGKFFAHPPLPKDS